MIVRIVLVLLALGAATFAVRADDLKVLTTGAMKPVLLEVAPGFQQDSKQTVSLDNDTAGALLKRIEAGAAFDVVVLTPAGIDELAKAGKVSPGVDLARVGVGVMVKAGAPRPDISTVDALKRTLLAAKSVAYIDPASGGSSGIYLARLWERLGIADALKPKTKLKQGGLVADLIVSGEAEIGFQQASEIVASPDVTLIGQLPEEIQNYTVYSGAISTAAHSPAAAAAFIAWLRRPAMAPFLQAKGLLPP
ncbi:MAG: substrate-binding domain-containing protein [Xanthobacteraceae bacterium]|nr:substrate-binding domain-containing protein [Xanthobacteraceae bacterium]